MGYMLVFQFFHQQSQNLPILLFSIHSMQPSSYRAKLIFAFFAVYIIWGTTFFGVHLSLKSFPPFLLSALRLLIAGGALTVYCFIGKESFPSRDEIIRHALCGVVLFIGGIVAVVWAQQFISSSLAASIITTPFWFVILDRSQWKFYFSSKWIVTGLLIGLSGVILLMAFKTGRTGTGSEVMQIAAIVAMILGSFLWAAGSLYVKHRASTPSVYVSTAIQLLSAGIVTLLISYLAGELDSFSIANVRLDAMLSLLYLALVSSLLTFLCFMWLIKVQPPAIVSTYAYVNPLVATILGWAFANEHISSLQLLALGLILIGVFFVNVPKYLSR
jgi:drug/metabolite transporter (DMT)-like permease